MIHGCPVTTTGQLGERRCMLAGKSTPRREMKWKLLHTFSEAQLWFKQRQYCQDWSWNNLKKGKCFNKWQSRQCWNFIFTFSEKKWAISDVLIFPLKILRFFSKLCHLLWKKKKRCWLKISCWLWKCSVFLHSTGGLLKTFQIFHVDNYISLCNTRFKEGGTKL